MVGVNCKTGTHSKVDGPFLEESQITICDGLKVCIELRKQAVRVAGQYHSGLGFYG